MVFVINALKCMNLYRVNIYDLKTKQPDFVNMTYLFKSYLTANHVRKRAEDNVS